MFAVIFKATINELDGEYYDAASRLRELALTEYGCTEFSSYTQGSEAVAISYWPSKVHIQAWKGLAEHRRVQELGKTRWYRSYHVQVVEILTDYSNQD